MGLRPFPGKDAEKPVKCRVFPSISIFSRFFKNRKNIFAMNILLINPWITDFAAYDFWVKPLGLLYVGAFLRQRGHSVRLIDCTDRFQDGGLTTQETDQARHYNTGKFHREIIEKPSCLKHIPRYFNRYGIPPELFDTLVKSGPRPDVVCISCVMTYWYHGAFEAILRVRELLPGVPVVLGGIYATLCPGHAAAESGADVVITESQPSRIIDAVEYVGGKQGRGKLLQDDFGLWPEPLWDNYGTLLTAVVMTTHGCPMRCTVCASRLLFDGFERRPVSDAVLAIKKLAARGVEDIAFSDDALLIDAERYALPLFEELVVEGAPVRLHTPNGLHLREITPKLASVMRKAGVTTVRLSLETTSEERESDFSGKVTRDDFRRAADALFGAGYTADELGSYILAGLPGQTMGEVFEAIRFSIETGVPVKPALFSPVPGTVEFDRAVEAGMIRRDDDPVLQNNTLRSVDIWQDNPEGYKQFKRIVTGANDILKNEGRPFAEAEFCELFRVLEKNMVL